MENKQLLHGSDEWVAEKVEDYLDAVPIEYRYRIDSIRYACGNTFMVRLKKPFVGRNSWNFQTDTVTFIRKDALVRFVLYSYKNPDYSATEDFGNYVIKLGL